MKIFTICIVSTCIFTCACSSLRDSCVRTAPIVAMTRATLDDLAETLDGIEDACDALLLNGDRYRCHNQLAVARAAHDEASGVVSAASSACKIPDVSKEIRVLFSVLDGVRAITSVCDVVKEAP